MLRESHRAAGRVASDVGFNVEPEAGGLALVPGSAREVPPWVLAGPIVARVAAVIERLSRGFVPVENEHASPRGRGDWNDYARRSVPGGRWDDVPVFVLGTRRQSRPRRGAR